jgi:hypothetical protein
MRPENRGLITAAVLAVTVAAALLGLMIVLYRRWF